MLDLINPSRRIDLILQKSRDLSKKFIQNISNSKPTLATILVDLLVNQDVISEDKMKNFWLEVIEPLTDTTKNKRWVDRLRAREVP